MVTNAFFSLLDIVLHIQVLDKMSYRAAQNTAFVKEICWITAFTAEYQIKYRSEFIVKQTEAQMETCE